MIYSSNKNSQQVRDASAWLRCLSSTEIQLSVLLWKKCLLEIWWLYMQQIQIWPLRQIRIIKLGPFRFLKICLQSSFETWTSMKSVNKIINWFLDNILVWLINTGFENDFSYIAWITTSCNKYLLCVCNWVHLVFLLIGSTRTSSDIIVQMQPVPSPIWQCSI